MNSIFYRKAGAGGGIRGAVARLRTNRRMVLVLVVGVPVALYVLFGPRGIVARIQIGSERARLEEELHQAEAETRRLQAESKALEGDTRAIEKVARERYGMVKEGETVYRVKRND
jgi:cell division protein FtsB